MTDTRVSGSQRQRAGALALVLLGLSGALLLLALGVGSTGFESVLRVRDDPLAA